MPSLSLSAAVKSPPVGGPTMEMIGKPPSTVTPITDRNDPFSAAKKGKPKRPKGGKKINKADIGLPSDFRSHPYTHSTPDNGRHNGDMICSTPAFAVVCGYSVYSTCLVSSCLGCTLPAVVCELSVLPAGISLTLALTLKPVPLT